MTNKEMDLIEATLAKMAAMPLRVAFELGGFVTVTRTLVFLLAVRVAAWAGQGST